MMGMFWSRRFCIGVLAGLWLLGGTPQPAEAAGGRVHMEMGQQARRLFLTPEQTPMCPGLADLFSDHDSACAYYCGCMFPDWGYATGVRDAGEECHWRPFQETYREYLMERFPRPWSAEARREIAFFLGALVHGVTDVAWQPVEEHPFSFMDVTARMDKTPPDQMDTLFDVHAYAKLPLEVSLTGRFWWPQESVLEVLQRRGHEPPGDELERGRRILETAWTLGSTMGVVGEFPYRNVYKWGKEHYIKYWFGGVENAGASASMWVRYFYTRLLGGHYCQQMVQYAWRPSGYVPYLGARDTVLSSTAPDHNAGGEPVLSFSSDGSDGRSSALLSFDLAEVPKDIAVGTAKLWLYFLGRDAQAEPKVIEAFAVNRSWAAGGRMSDEVNGAQGEPATVGEATWLATASGGTLWAAPGCEGVPEDRAGEPADTVTIAPDMPEGRWFGWDITPLVRRWLDKPEGNHGVLLRETDESRRAPGALRFVASEAFKCQADGMGGGWRVAWRPALVILPPDA